MLKYKLTKQALDFLKKIPAKHAKQIIEKIEKLATNPQNIDCEQLEGFPHLKRFKSGEYRVIFRIDEGVLTLFVVRIGKRNDGEVYKHLENVPHQ